MDTKHERWLVDGRTVYALTSGGVNRFSAQVQSAGRIAEGEATEIECEWIARLMGAAPDMLAVLVAVNEALKWECREDEHGNLTERVREVIAKATGVEP